MPLFDLLAQALYINMGVDLRALYGGVAQHGLDMPYVRAVLQEVGGEGVAQLVGLYCYL